MPLGPSSEACSGQGHTQCSHCPQPSLPGMAASGCSNKWPQAWWLKTTFSSYSCEGQKSDTVSLVKARLSTGLEAPARTHFLPAFPASLSTLSWYLAFPPLFPQPHQSLPTSPPHSSPVLTCPHLSSWLTFHQVGHHSPRTASHPDVLNWTHLRNPDATSRHSHRPKARGGHGFGAPAVWHTTGPHH